MGCFRGKGRLRRVSLGPFRFSCCSVDLFGLQQHSLSEICLSAFPPFGRSVRSPKQHSLPEISLSFRFSSHSVDPFGIPNIIYPKYISTSLGLSLPCFCAKGYKTMDVGRGTSQAIRLFPCNRHPLKRTVLFFKKSIPHFDVQFFNTSIRHNSES